MDHILRAASAVSNHARFVVVGTGAVIVTARRIPAIMMMTPEIDVYADGVADPEPISDLIDASIGQGSLFHRTFSYYCDGVSPGTAIMPDDWRTRATEYVTPDGLVTAICPEANNIAVAELCAWREKDREWLQAAVIAGIADKHRMGALLRTAMPDSAPGIVELLQRLDILGPPGE
ncbi:MAG: hypothetical protein EXR07_17755 [Acetobacteraceae bacterium]|nr:hypothetical protein [Acetobacteraceae bacterium]